jgi:hypothetical protein
MLGCLASMRDKASRNNRFSAATKTRTLLATLRLRAASVPSVRLGRMSWVPAVPEVRGAATLVTTLRLTPVFTWDAPCASAPLSTEPDREA